MTKWELTKWEVDQIGIDEVGIDKVGITLLEKEIHGRSVLICFDILGAQFWSSLVVSLVNPVCHSACRLPIDMVAWTRHQHFHA